MARYQKHSGRHVSGDCRECSLLFTNPQSLSFLVSLNAFFPFWSVCDLYSFVFSFFFSFWFLWQWRCRFATVYLFINKTVLSLPVRSDAVHKQWISSCLSHRKTAFTDKSISTSRELERSSLIPFVGSRFFLSCFGFNCENRKTNNFN